MSSAELASKPDIIEAALNYAVRTDAKPVSETYGKAGLERRYTGKYERHGVGIGDGRAIRDGLSVDKNGFELVDQPTAMRDFFDKDALQTTYYREMENLIA